MQKDERNIEKARKEFSQKEFEKALELYSSIPSEMLTELDRKIIQFCKIKMNQC